MGRGRKRGVVHPRAGFLRIAVLQMIEFVPCFGVADRGPDRPRKCCLSVFRHPEQNAEDHDRDQGHGHIEEDLARAGLLADLPVGQFLAIIGDSDLLRMLKIVCQLPG